MDTFDTSAPTSPQADTSAGSSSLEMPSSKKTTLDKPSLEKPSLGQRIRAGFSGPPNVFTILVLILLVANYFGIMGDLDWTWQIRTGELIVESQTLRTPESFSYTIGGERVHDFEWIYEVLLWSVWSTLGLGGLKFLKMMLVATPMVLLSLRLKKEGVRWHGIALSLFIAAWIIAGAWNLRALYATTIGLLLVSGWLHDHCRGREQLTWWLPVVMLLWSNLHPGVITGQGLLFGAIAWEWANRWLKWNSVLEPQRLYRLTLIGGLGFLATFLSPNPIDRLLYPFRPNLAHPIQRWFIEMRPLSHFFENLPMVVLAAYFLGAICLITVLLRIRHFRVWELALLAGVTVLGNFAVRCLADWTFIMLALVVPQMKELLADIARTGRRRWWARRLLYLDSFFRRLLDSKMFRFQPAYPIAVAGLLLILTLFPSYASSLPMQHRDEWPVQAMNQAQELGLKGNFFGSPDHGAYVGWRLRDNAKVYTDTRGFFFPPELLVDSIRIPEKGDRWRQRLDRVLDEYATDYLILDKNGPRGALWRDLQPWVGDPICEDNLVVVLKAGQVRKGLGKLDIAQNTAK